MYLVLKLITVFNYKAYLSMVLPQNAKMKQLNNSCSTYGCDSFLTSCRISNYACANYRMIINN